MRKATVRSLCNQLREVSGWAGPQPDQLARGLRLAARFNTEANHNPRLAVVLQDLRVHLRVHFSDISLDHSPDRTVDPLLEDIDRLERLMLTGELNAPPTNH
jgi:hypothetical protein